MGGPALQSAVQLGGIDTAVQLFPDLVGGVQKLLDAGALFGGNPYKRGKVKHRKEKTDPVFHGLIFVGDSGHKIPLVQHQHYPRGPV